jgi:nucleotide-binding universal stress UspA family protein
MPDYYHGPAIVLTALLLPAFGYLYLRFRDTRTLLWFLGFLLAIVRMLLLYRLGPWDFGDGSHPWVSATGQLSIQVGSALFLASLSPLSFRIGRIKILYVIPYALPLVVYSVLFEGVFHGISPRGPVFLLFPALGAISLLVALFWGASKGSLPIGIGVSACILLGSLGLWLCFTHGAAWPLTFVECANHFMTALLLVYVFRRFSPGVILSVLGFAAWSMTILEIFPAIALNPALDLNLIHVIVMGKVVAALGMIVLALEDQITINTTARQRERRARLELQAYSRLILSRRRVEDFDHQGTEICETVAEHSRFAQAVLLVLGSTGRYRVAGAAGMDNSTVTSLDMLAARIPVEGFLAPGSAPLAVEHSQTLSLDLEPWLRPGDDLKRRR